MAARRSHGTGSLIVRRGAWHGQWRVGGRLVSRKLGAVRQPGTREGLTKSQAEAALRQAMQAEVAAPVDARLTVAEAGERYVAHLRDVRERKPSTISDYEGMVRQFGRFFPKTIDRIGEEDVEAYLAAKKRDGLSTKTVANHLILARRLRLRGQAQVGA